MWRFIYKVYEELIKEHLNRSSEEFLYLTSFLLKKYDEDENEIEPKRNRENDG